MVEKRHYSRLFCLLLFSSVKVFGSDIKNRSSGHILHRCKYQVAVVFLWEITCLSSHFLEKMNPKLYHKDREAGGELKCKEGTRDSNDFLSSGHKGWV